MRRKKVVTRNFGSGGRPTYQSGLRGGVGNKSVVGNAQREERKRPNWRINSAT